MTTATEKICHHAGYADSNLDAFDAPQEGIYYVIEQMPLATVGQMREAVEAMLAHVDDVARSLRELRDELAAKTSDAPLAAEYADAYREFIARDEHPCGSQLRWLLVPALDRYRAGDVEALQRFQRALGLMEPIYLSQHMADPNSANGLHSDNFDRYCDTVVDYVSGKSGAVTSYAAFLDEQ